MPITKEMHSLHGSRATCVWLFAYCVLLPFRQMPDVSWQRKGILLLSNNLMVPETDHHIAISFYLQLSTAGNHDSLNSLLIYRQHLYS